MDAYVHTLANKVGMDLAWYKLDFQFKCTTEVSVEAMTQVRGYVCSLTLGACTPVAL